MMLGPGDVRNVGEGGAELRRGSYAQLRVDRNT